MAFRKELRSDISPSWAFLRHCFVSEVLQNSSGMVEEYPALFECTDERRGTPFCTRQVPAYCAKTQHEVKLFVGNIRSLLASEQPIYGRSELAVRRLTRADWLCFIGDKKHWMCRPRNNRKGIYCWTWRTTTAVNGRLLCKDTTFELRAAWTAVGRHSRNSQLCLPSEEVVVQDGWSWTWRPHYERSALRKVRAVTLLFILSVTCPFWGGCYGLLSRTTWVLCSFESTTLATCCKKSEIKCLTSTDALKVWFSRT